ncbi:MAG: hypothetical protein AB7T10_00615 [bacterium]
MLKSQQGDKMIENNDRERQFQAIQKEAIRMLKVEVYVDTSIIPRSSTRVGDKGINILIDDLYNFQDEEKIEILSMQGSAEDIHPERNSQGKDRERNRILQTFPIATESVTNNNYFGNSLRRDIFETMFPNHRPQENYYNRYIGLAPNDQNDYKILIDSIEDSNGECFFLTLNSRDFIDNGRETSVVSHKSLDI